MNTTLKERLEIYHKALKYYQNNLAGRTGMCFPLSHLTGILVTNMADQYPELYAQKPVIPADYLYWWNVEEIEPRIDAFLAAIKIVENKLSKNLDD